MASERDVVPAGLAAAILQRRQLRFCYRKDPGASAPRVVNPHVVSESAAGHVRLHGVQVAGPSSHEPTRLPGWRTFDVALMTDVEVLATGFRVAGDYQPGSPIYDRMLIDCLHGWRVPASPGRR